MSVFQVQLNNVKQGLLDLDPSTDVAGHTYGNLGTAFATSKQRQIYVAGPHRTYRLLVDGATFTDCNYWKRFAYPQVDYQFAFIKVVTDDGSVYSDVPSENVSVHGATITTTTSFADNIIDFVNTYGGPATFLQVQNRGSSSDLVTGQLNGDANVTFVLAAGDTQVFNVGDMMITMLKLKGSGSISANWLASVKSTINS